jgi:hypothetical protein
MAIIDGILVVGADIKKLKFTLQVMLENVHIDRTVHIHHEISGRKLPDRIAWRGIGLVQSVDLVGHGFQTDEDALVKLFLPDIPCLDEKIRLYCYDANDGYGSQQYNQPYSVSTHSLVNSM